MSARYLVVDGHSVIFAWPDLRKLHDLNRAAARRALTDRLRHLHDTTGWRVTVVLDGRLGTAVSREARKATEMVVSYATADQTADSVIERLVAASGVAKDILVITADEAERLTVESLGAATASPGWLRKELEREGAVFGEELERVHRSARWKK
ncbi:MAG TPA: NYN domain-containing protein [Candidatus Methylacidiphilales bacterium]|jgi:predicted RNA-binding protein with PIN domain|nr:NYN domain-containing protein [Candidatus Methylacidiphilales bacterium]